MNKQNRFIGAIILQIVIICAIAIFKLSVVNGGTDVLVHIHPVDPSDLIRGDYITFQYDISSVPTYYFGGAPTVGQTVYVTLDRSFGSTYWTMIGASLRKPSDSIVFVKGTVQSVDNSTVRLVYGAEDYFIPEGEGRNVSFWQKDAAAALAVDDNGNAVLKQIYLDGKLWP